MPAATSRLREQIGQRVPFHYVESLQDSFTHLVAALVHFHDEPGARGCEKDTLDASVGRVRAASDQVVGFQATEQVAERCLSQFQQGGKIALNHAVQA